jgi:16S rRNA A1518/A1519 N6-dimethyltransferase RsmA/KsgA/DIM1 with predicted DNA glycosylase/AP lyase activity
MSAVVRLRFREPIAEVGDLRVFERVVRGLFLHRRKILLRALTPVAESLGRDAAQVLIHTGLDPRGRPDTLTIHDMARLSRAML